jgi:HSP20 family protein
MPNVTKDRDRPQEQRGGLARREPFGPSLWSMSPFSLMRRFSQEMDRMFGPGFWATPEREQIWAPEIEVLERENELIVRADLPGLKKDDVEIEVKDNELWIQGERREEHEERREGLYRSERRYGSFCRAIPLPPGVEADKAKASFRDGVLEIAMPAPRQEQRRGRRLEIQEAK